MCPRVPRCGRQLHERKTTEEGPSAVLRVPSRAEESFPPVKEDFISCLYAEVRKLFLGFLLLNCFQLKITFMPKKVYMGLNILVSFKRFIDKQLFI